MLKDNIRFVRLTPDNQQTSFYCGDIDLNEFLTRDAIDYQNSLLAVTYLVKEGDVTIGYVSIANDKISIHDSNKSGWRRIKKSFNHSKHRADYPAVKIGRLAVDKDYQDKDIGTIIIDFIKCSFIDNNRTGCIFVTVDALRSALPFYIKNKFKFLDDSQLNVDSHTVLLYYNLTELI